MLKNVLEILAATPQKLHREIAAMIDGNEPALPACDQAKRALERRYDRKDPRASLASFIRQRRANLKWLRTLKPAELRRKGLHQTVGEVTAGEMIHEWAFHDLGHLKQIMEVKRCALCPHMGNMRKFYKLS